MAPIEHGPELTSPPTLAVIDGGTEDHGRERTMHESDWRCLAPNLLTSDVLSPIQQHVPGLGDIMLLHRQADIYHSGSRVSRWYRVNVDGYGNGIRVTDPDPNQKNGITIVRFPGCAQTIENGPSRDMHNALARLFPGVRLIDIETDGVGTIGEPLTRQSAGDHDLKTMAAQRLKLMKALCGKDPTLLLPVSMSTVMVSAMLDMDLRDGHNLVTQPLYFGSAIVPPESAARDMGLFLPSATIESPRDACRIAWGIGTNVLRHLVRHDAEASDPILPLAIQIRDLAKGVSYEQVSRVTQIYGGDVLSGQFDPLANWGMWGQIKAAHPNLETHPVRNKGHGIVNDGEKAARLVAAVVSKRHIFERLLAQAA